MDRDCRRGGGVVYSWSAAVLGVAAILSSPCGANPTVGAKLVVPQAVSPGAPKGAAANVAVTPGFKPSRFPGVAVRDLPGGTNAAGTAGSSSMVYLRPGQSSASFAAASKGSVLAGGGTIYAGKSRAKGEILVLPPGHFPYETMARPKAVHSTSPVHKKSAGAAKSPQTR